MKNELEPYTDPLKLTPTDARAMPLGDLRLAFFNLAEEVEDMFPAEAPPRLAERARDMTRDEIVSAVMEYAEWFNPRGPRLF